MLIRVYNNSNELIGGSKMKRLLFVVMILSTALMGCSNSLIGTYNVKDISELVDRKEYVEDWLESSKFIVDREKKITLITESGNGKLTVKSPPTGSGMLLYQDNATTQRDGWLPYASTQTEVHFIHLLGTTCKWIECEDMWEKADTVAKRLKDKVKYMQVEGITRPQAVIHRVTEYNYKDKKWEEKTEEVYIEDILDTAYAFMLYGEERKEQDYLDIAEDLMDTVLALQKDIVKNQKPDLKGSLYLRLTDYDNKQKYRPSWDSYPYSIGYSHKKTMEKANDLFNNLAYKESADLFKRWIGTQLKKKDLFNEEGVPYIGLDGNGDFVRNVEHTWDEEEVTSTKEVYKFIAVAKQWYPNGKNLNSIESLSTSKEVSSQWVMAEEIKENGNVKFSSKSIEVPKAYYLQYLYLEGKDEEVKSLLKDLMRKQRLKGDNVSKGAWIEGYHTNVAHTFEIIETICSIYEPE